MIKRILILIFFLVHFLVIAQDTHHSGKLSESQLKFLKETIIGI